MAGSVEATNGEDLHVHQISFLDQMANALSGKKKDSGWWNILKRALAVGICGGA
jgi:hypothetical protein